MAIGGVDRYAVVRGQWTSVDPADDRRFADLGGWVAATIATEPRDGSDHRPRAVAADGPDAVFTVTFGAALLAESVDSGPVTGGV